jgi:hypothetical protein
VVETGRNIGGLLVVGREAELRCLDDFVHGFGSASALVLVEERGSARRLCGRRGLSRLELMGRERS